MASPGLGAHLAHRGASRPEISIQKIVREGSLSSRRWTVSGQRGSRWAANPACQPTRPACEPSAGHRPGGNHPAIRSSVSLWVQLGRRIRHLIVQASSLRTKCRSQAAWQSSGHPLERVAVDSAWPPHPPSDRSSPRTGAGHRPRGNHCSRVSRWIHPGRRVRHRIVQGSSLRAERRSQPPGTADLIPRDRPATAGMRAPTWTHGRGR